MKIKDKRRQIILDTVWRNWNQDKWNIIVFTVIHRYTGDIRRRHIQCTTLGYRLQVEALSDLYPKVIAKTTTLKHHPKGRCFFLFFLFPLELEKVLICCNPIILRKKFTFVSKESFCFWFYSEYISIHTYSFFYLKKKCTFSLIPSWVFNFHREF